MRVKTTIMTGAALMLFAAAQAQEVKEAVNELNVKTVSAPAPAQEAAPGITVSQAMPVEPAPAAVTVQKPGAAPENAVETIEINPELAGQGSMRSGLISLGLKEVELSNVIRLFATLSDANIIVPDLGAEIRAVKVDVNLKDVEWKPALQAILDSHELELYEKIPGTEVYSVRKKLPAAEAIKNTRTFLFKHADIKQAETVIKGIVGDRGQVYAYPQGNAVVVKTTQEIMDDVAQIAERIDTPRQQALIEARIMELSDGGSKERGVDLRWDKILSGSATAATAGNPLNGALDLGSVGVPNTLKDATLTGVGALTLDSDDLFIFIKALQTKGDARTVSNPKVIVANGETAKINILEKVPRLQRSLTETESAGGGVTRVVEVEQDEDGLDPDTQRKRYVEYEFGIRLAVTPTIYTEDNIAVQIVPIISRVNEEKTIRTQVTAASGDDPAIIDTYYAIDEKRVNTTFMLGNKRTAVIGGLTEARDIDRERKVPLLGSIPLIRHLFTHKYTEKVQTENIVFVTVSLEDGKNFDVAKAVKQSPLTRKQLIRDDNNQVVDDCAVELFKANSDSRIQDEFKIIERKEQGGVHDRTLLAPVRKVLRP